MDKPIKRTDPRHPRYGEIATTRDGRDITRGYVLPDLPLPPQDKILNHLGNNYANYRALKKDDQIHSTTQQRRRAITAKEWEITPADTSRINKKAAQWFTDLCERLDIDRIHDKMWWGLFYGFAVGEPIFEKDGRFVNITDIRVRNQERFLFDGDMRLRLRTLTNPLGELLPPENFWVFATGTDNDDEPYGLGLAHYLYWPSYFKRNGFKHWARFLEKFGIPTKWGQYSPNASKQTRQELLATLKAMDGDSGLITPLGTMIELIESSRTGTADYQDLIRLCNEAIAKIVLSQTMTTDNGSSRSQAEVHQGVANDVIKSDADLICQSFNRHIIEPLCTLNFPDAQPPKFWRIIDDPEDLNTRIERDKTLTALGFPLKPNAVPELYGDHYIIPEGDQKEAMSLNGEQFQTLTELIQAIASNTIPVETGIRLVQLSFPALAEEQIRAMLSPIEQAPIDPSPSPIEPPQFAETPDPEFLSALQAKLNSETTPILENWIDQLRQLHSQSADLPEFAANLTTLWPDLNREDLANLIAQSTTLANLGGHHDP